jgi:hypothetical protein
MSIRQLCGSYTSATSGSAGVNIFHICAGRLDWRFNFSPTCMMASMAGINSLPSAVSEYSIDGGDDAMRVRLTTPLSSSDRNRAVRTLAVMVGKSTRSSPKRRGPPLKYHKTFGVQAPPINDMHCVMGQSGGCERFFRSLSAISRFLVSVGKPHYYADGLLLHVRARLLVIASVPNV